MHTQASAGKTAGIPFDQHRVDRIMEEHGLDVLVATSKHNVQYMLGGYKFIFFSAMDAIGHSRYLPVVIYRKGKPEQAAYVANKMEGAENAVHPFWTPTLHANCWGSVDAAEQAAKHLKSLNLGNARIGIEPAFLPSDAHAVLAASLGYTHLVDATGAFERIRAIKTPEELNVMRQASERITDSMLAVFAASEEGSTKEDIVEALRREETNRGLQFEYCLITLGSNFNRAVSAQAWKKGEVMSLDSGGNYKGYIGDLCRMGILGEPDAELEDLMADILEVQEAAISRAKAGNLGGDVVAGGEDALRKKTHIAPFTDFFTHGMGLITHEAPFLMTNHPVAYEGVDAARRLEAGMVISVETTMLHPSRGFIKIEDTVAIHEGRAELVGDRGRGWNRGGTTR
ncbi:M24 family metallopeptidase [Arvimicrobium flavum]|uniref:M24 family metallopeptidase n=1 Tax=Arvimicrobium flavum TaxID=3393320 RepID=UPI00237A0A8F|nr:Xaa-Pro peptidase family protein [Mesorhizobium shangrilense]